MLVIPLQQSTRPEIILSVKSDLYGLGPVLLACGDNCEAVSLTSAESTQNMAATGRTVRSSGAAVSPSGPDLLAPKGLAIIKGFKKVCNYTFFCRSNYP